MKLLGLSQRTRHWRYCLIESNAFFLFSLPPTCVMFVFNVHVLVFDIHISGRCRLVSPRAAALFAGIVDYRAEMFFDSDGKF